METDHQALLLSPRPLRARSYSAGEALAAAEHAAAIYGDARSYRNACRLAGFANAVTIDSGAVQLGVAYSSGAIVVAVRGSSGWADWLGNLLLFRWPWRRVGGRVHLGFQLQARLALREVLPILRALDAPEYRRARLYIAGHSLGGAVACQLAGALRDRKPIVFAFESPRVGDRAWGGWFDGLGIEAYRVVRVSDRWVPDIVTRLPMSASGWWHCGSPVILRAGERYMSEDAWETARAAGGAVRLPWWRVVSRLAEGARAHGVAGLLEELRRQAGARGRIDSRASRPAS